MYNVLEHLPKQDVAFVETIKHIVATHYGMTTTELLTRTTKRVVAQRRMISIALCREYTKATVYELAAMHNLTNHASTIHAVKTINNLRATNRKFRGEYYRIMEKVEQSIVGEQSKTLVCQLCGGTNLSSSAKVDPNTRRIQRVRLDDAFCHDCNRDVQLVNLTFWVCKMKKGLPFETQ